MTKNNNEKENTVVEDSIEIEEPIVIPSDEAVKEENKKSEEYKELAQRIQAEFENFRKRNNDAVKIAKIDGNNEIILNIIPVIDNFERGLDVLDDSARVGVELIYKQLKSVLTKYGVEEIPALGEEFDPLIHHAIAQCEAEEDNANKIVEVFQKGYKRKDKVLRPAMVKVAQ